MDTGYGWLFWLLTIPALLALFNVCRLIWTWRNLPTPPLRDALSQADEVLDGLALTREDKADVADELDKLAAELGRADPDPCRVRRYYRRVQEVAPPVAEAVASSEPLAHLLAGKGE
jgi:hypothetical protein